MVWIAGDAGDAGLVVQHRALGDVGGDVGHDDEGGRGTRRQ